MEIGEADFPIHLFRSSLRYGDFAACGRRRLGLLAPLDPLGKARAPCNRIFLTSDSHLFGSETNREVVEDNF